MRIKVVSRDVTRQSVSLDLTFCIVEACHTLLHHILENMSAMLHDFLATLDSWKETALLHLLPAFRKYLTFTWTTLYALYARYCYPLWKRAPSQTKKLRTLRDTLLDHFVAKPPQPPESLYVLFTSDLWLVCTLSLFVLILLLLLVVRWTLRTTLRSGSKSGNNKNSQSHSKLRVSAQDVKTPVTKASKFISTPPPTMSSGTRNRVFGDSQSSTLQLQRAYHDQGYEYIKTALDLEEKKSNDLALDFYLKGMQEIKAALRLKFSDEECVQAEVLDTKMRTNLKLVEERVSAITGKHNIILGTPKRLNGTTPTTKISPIGRTTTPAAVPAAQKTAKPKTSITPTAIRRKPDGPTASPKAAESHPERPKSQYLKNVDPQLANAILNEVLVNGTNVSWDSIAGLSFAKQALKEIVILPSLRPELFTGLRAPAKGVLLFGPPGTGKTLLAKAVAHESRSTFFSISAASLTSKFVGESEKMVRALFATARELQPSIIFIDEVDSILTERKENEHEASRRLKTEFLLQFDGTASETNERVLVMAATNRPQELDDAAIRRFPKRIYIPLPDAETRLSLLKNLLKGQDFSIPANELSQLVKLTEGYSGSDMSELAKEAALGPLRELGDSLLEIPADEVRSIKLKDFQSALTMIRTSVPQSSLRAFESWNDKFGKTGA